MTQRSVTGFNAEGRKGREDAVKYCKAWEYELMRVSTALNVDYTSKKISQAVYNLKKEELKKQTEELNKCIQTLNSQAQKM
jgi:hypothetical protein